MTDTTEKKEYWNTKALFSYEDIHRFEKVGHGDNRAAFVVLKELELEAKKRLENN